MKNILILLTIVMLSLCLHSSGVAKLTIVSEGVLWDDISNMYFYQDLPNTTNMTIEEQEQFAANLTTNPKFQSNDWTEWHIASFDEMEALYNAYSKVDIVEAFIPTAQGQWSHTTLFKEIQTRSSKNPLTGNHRGMIVFVETDQYGNFIQESGHLWGEETNENYVRDSLGALIVAHATPSFVSKYHEDATSITDLNGNGFPEIAVLNTHNDHVYATLKDSNDKTLVGRINFFSKKWVPKAIATLTDMNGNGTDELAVLAVKKENGKMWVKVVDSVTREVLNWVYFLNQDWMAMGLTTVADLNNNGVDELAVLVVKKSTRKASTMIRDAETAEQLKWICY